MSFLGKKTKLAVQVVVSFSILGVLFSQLDGNRALEALSRANLIPLLFAVLVLVADRVWMAWKWKLLLHVTSTPISFGEAVRVYYISSFQGNALPLGGLGPDVVRYLYLRHSRMTSQSVAVSIAMERIIGLLATLILAAVASVLIVNQVGYTDETYSLVGVGLFGGTVGSVILGSLLFNRGLQKAIYRRIGHAKFLTRYSSFPKLAEALRQYGNRSRLLSSNLILSLIEQLFPVVAFFLGGLAFQLPLSFWDCLAIIPFSSLLQRLPISYAGLGIREGVQVFLLGMMNVVYSDALVLSSVLFLVFLVSLIPGAVLSFAQREFEEVNAA